MFDIGFSEILIISVVAILVVGPKEFPALVRTFGRWMGKARSVAGDVKGEFQRELAQAEELTRRVERESEIAELHNVIDETKATIPINAPVGAAPAAGKERSAPDTVSPETGGKSDGGA